jgi:hypothetical protein
MVFRRLLLAATPPTRFWVRGGSPRFAPSVLASHHQKHRRAFPSPAPALPALLRACLSAVTLRLRRMRMVSAAAVPARDGAAGVVGGPAPARGGVVPAARDQGRVCGGNEGRGTAAAAAAATSGDSGRLR